jgi:acetyl esterase/lipase
MRLRVENVVLLGVLTGCVATEPEEAAVSDATASDVEIVADVVYGHKFGMALTLDVYRPAQPNGAGVVFMNSGGWFSPVMEFHTEDDGSLRMRSDAELRGQGRPAPQEGVEAGADPSQFSPLPLLESGFTVFNVRHGSGEKFVLPEVVEDVRYAIRFIRETAPDYGVSPERLGIWGGSAGGHLSLLLGTTPEIAPGAAEETAQSEASVSAVVAYFPATDLATLRPNAARWTQENFGVDLLTFFTALDYPAEQDPEVSPVYYATAGDPPTLIIHGDQDPLAPLTQGQRMHDALREAGAISELIVIEGGVHGFRGDDADFALAQTVSWFQRHLQ